MGSLKPETKYIYEKVNGVTYAREFGADPSTRQAIGWDYEYRQTQDEAAQLILWKDVWQAANTNPTLQKALDRVIMIYRLSKDKPL